MVPLKILFTLLPITFGYSQIPDQIIVSKIEIKFTIKQVSEFLKLPADHLEIMRLPIDSLMAVLYINSNNSVHNSSLYLLKNQDAQLEIIASIHDNEFANLPECSLDSKHYKFNSSTPLIGIRYGHPGVHSAEWVMLFRPFKGTLIKVLETSISWMEEIKEETSDGAEYDVISTEITLASSNNKTYGVYDIISNEKTDGKKKVRSVLKWDGQSYKIPKKFAGAYSVLSRKASNENK